tara:strand:+ start:1642 stop:2010 length:369 start_codon:yes stop_codon:yes gene_type:complete
MRLTGFVTINGTRERLDWTLLGSEIVEGPGISAAEVALETPLPQVTTTVAEIEYTDNYSDSTVTDLRTMLSQRGEPVYGNKEQLIQRLRDWDAANPDGYVEETSTEEDNGEVSEDESDGEGE